MVGDVKQCIYRFRGADLTFFQRLSQQFQQQQHTSRLVHLNDNFRSSANVLSIINPIFHFLFEKHSNHKTHYTPLQAMKSLEGHVQAVFLKDSIDQQAEFEAISRQCYLALHEKKLEAKDILILTRERRYGEKIKDYLTTKGFSVSMDKQKGFFQQQVVLDCFNSVKGLCHQSDYVTWLSLLQSPFFDVPTDICFEIIMCSGKNILENVKHIYTLYPLPAKSKKM